jgi:hypothetical protein
MIIFLELQEVIATSQAAELNAGISVLLPFQ